MAGLAYGAFMGSFSAYAWERLPLVLYVALKVPLLLLAWTLLYAFVGMQMGWMLRPFVGSHDLPVTFFRDEPFSNAYIAILQLFFG
jgi:hypothetical protein